MFFFARVSNRSVAELEYVVIERASAALYVAILEKVTNHGEKNKRNGNLQRVDRIWEFFDRV